MFFTVESVTALSDFRLSILFRNGERKIYDTKPLIIRNEAFRSFRLTRGLFEQAEVVPGGYGIYWNENIDIGCNELYLNGTPVLPGARHETI